MGMIGNAPYQGVIDTGNILDGAITAAKLKAAADLIAKLGYTPVNKAGDTISGNLKVQVFGNAESTVQYGNGLSAKLGAYAAETALELPSPSALFKLRSRAGTFDTIGITATYSGTEKNGLLVDNLGRVTLPSQPAFEAGGGTAGGNGVVTTTTPTLVIWSQDIVNRGSHYDKTTGLFTAPVGGVYHFNTHIQQRWAGGFQVWVRKNGVDTYRLGYSANSEDGPGMAHCITLTLAANDTIGISVARVSSPADAYLGGSNYDIAHFSGFLVG